MDTKLYSTSTLGMFEQTRRAAQLDDIDLALASLQVRTNLGYIPGSTTHFST